MKKLAYVINYSTEGQKVLFASSLKSGVDNGSLLIKGVPPHSHPALEDRESHGISSEGGIKFKLLMTS